MAMLKFTEDHEWIRVEGDIATIGITDHAQQQLGDVVYVELPEVDSRVEASQSFGTVESVKAVSDIYSPVAGEVTEVNPTLADNPALVNQDPHGKAWLIKLKLDDPKAVEDLLTAAQYQQFVRAEEGDQA